MQSVYDDPQYWQERADEARATASRVSNANMKAAMLTIASEYDQIAKMVESR